MTSKVFISLALQNKRSSFVDDVIYILVHCLISLMGHFFECKNICQSEICDLLDVEGSHATTVVELVAATESSSLGVVIQGEPPM